MLKRRPYIWLQEHELSGKADCGCVLRNESQGPALWLCPMHSAAQDLLRICKHIIRWFKKRNLKFPNLYRKAEKIIAKAERKNHGVQATDKKDKR